MNVLVTGATGFIGKRLATSLVGAGHTVIGLSRDPERASAAVPAITRFYPWQPDEAPPPEALTSVDVIVHLAGESVAGRWTAARKRRILDSRVLGTRSLVQALNAGGGSKALISASAVGYYGDRADEELTETSLPGDGFLAEVTRSWEAEAQRAAELSHRVAVLRLGIVLGPEGGALKQMLPLFRLGLGGALGSGRQWWPWVHIDDVVAALHRAITAGWHGAFNVTAPRPVPQREFAARLAAALHRPAFLPVPAFALRLAQGGFADELLFSKRVLPAALQDAGFHFAYPELGDALANLLHEEDRSASLQAQA